MPPTPAPHSPSSSHHGLVVRPLQPPAPEPTPSPTPAGRSGYVAALAIATAMVLLAVAVLAATLVRHEHRRVLSRLDEDAFVRATAALEAMLGERRERALSAVKLLVDDTRVRATVVTPNFDEATVSDVLADLRTASGATVLAVLDPAGKLRARSGADLFGERDLGGVAAVKAALEQPAAAVWTFPDRVLVAAVAPIRSGTAVAALLLLAFEIDAAALTAIERSAGIDAAILVADRIVATGGRTAGLGPVFAAARTLSETGGVVPHEGRSFLVRSTRTTDSAAAGRVLWAVPQHHQAVMLGHLPALGFAPVALVALLLGLVALVVRRR